MKLTKKGYEKHNLTHIDSKKTAFFK